MGTAQRLLALIVCVYIFMYFGLNLGFNETFTGNDIIKIPGDIFDLFFKDSDSMRTGLYAYSQSLENSSSNLTVAINYDINENWSSAPVEQSGQESSPTIGFSLLDGLRLFFSFGITIFNLALFPITLLSVFTISPFIVLIFGVPLTMLFIFAVILLFRGIG